MKVKEIRRQNLRFLSRTVGGVTHLAERLSRSQSQISHLIGSNPVKNIGDKLAGDVERVFDKPSGWMDHEHPSIQEEAGEYAVSGRRTYSEVPLLTWQEAVTWDENKPTSKPSQYIITHLKVSSHSFALRVEGDGMESTTGVSFPNRSIILVDPEERVVNGTFVVAKQSANSQLMFKQLIIDGSKRYLKPLNPRYPLVEITPQVRIAGVVRLMLMEFK